MKKSFHKIKRGLINISDQGINVGIIVIFIGIVAAGGTYVYNKFFAVNEVNVISNIINEVRNMGDGSGGYGTANYNQAIISSEAISSKVKYSGTTIYNHSGGTITVLGANTGFSVTSTALTKKECINLASQLGTSDMATTKINSTSITGAVTTIAATAACTSDANTVAFTTKS